MAQPRRKWSDMRGVVESPAQQTVEEPIEQVLRRLFCATTDGQRVLNWMLEQSHAACPPGASDCALREREGARRFIANIRVLTQGDHAAKPAPRSDP
jgi:hypothetical protein